MIPVAWTYTTTTYQGVRFQVRCWLPQYKEVRQREKLRLWQIEFILLRIFSVRVFRVAQMISSVYLAVQWRKC